VDVTVFEQMVQAVHILSTFGTGNDLRQGNLRQIVVAAAKKSLVPGIGIGVTALLDDGNTVV
jgi:hypothetical protein